MSRSFLPHLRNILPQIYKNLPQIRTFLLWNIHAPTYLISSKHIIPNHPLLFCLRKKVVDGKSIVCTWFQVWGEVKFILCFILVEYVMWGEMSLTQKESWFKISDLFLFDICIVHIFMKRYLIPLIKLFSIMYWQMF